MKLYKTKKGNLLENEGKYYGIGLEWDELVNREGLHS